MRVFHGSSSQVMMGVLTPVKLKSFYLGNSPCSCSRCNACRFPDRQISSGLWLSAEESMWLSSLAM